MSTVYNFTPTPNSAFQFEPTLDGQTYTMVVTWNLWGRRYYLNCLTLQGAVIFSLPLIGSPPDRNISLTAGYFKSTVIYRVQNSTIEVSP